MFVRKEHWELMHLRKVGTLVLAAATAVLFTATVITGADAQKKKPGKSPVKPDNAKTLIAEGKTVYAKNNCGACHKIAGKGGATGPDLSRIGKHESPKELVDYIRTPKKKNPNSIMPAYGPDQINDKQLKALVAYLHSLK
jgi:mono/diheme cytochrome c family protein